MFGMLSVLAELQRELIVANTRDGLAAARRSRPQGRTSPEAQPRTDRPRPTALRRRRAHRPTDRRHLQRPAHDRLRASRAEQQGQAPTLSSARRGRLNRERSGWSSRRLTKWRLVTRFLPAPQLAAGRHVAIAGFGVRSQRARGARGTRPRDRATGETIQICASCAARFYAASTLKSQLHGCPRPGASRLNARVVPRR
jgi:hypothetical protein